LYFIQKKYRPHSWDTLSDDEKAKYDFTEDRHGNILIRRPHLKEFFAFLFETCSVSLWTLSDQEYADGIASMILKHYFSDKKYAFTSIYCDKTDEESAEYFGGRKNLKYFYEDAKKTHVWPGNTILIDDLPANSVNAQNQRNSITEKPFALFGEVKDRSDPYEDVSRDRVLLEIVDLLQHILQRMTPQEPIFSEQKCKDLGITHLLRTIDNKGAKVQGVGIGDSHLFSKKSPKTHSKTKTKTKTKSKSPQTRKNRRMTRHSRKSRK
jgi:hypothetical protein